ncbi:unnamed protein product [Effrenium voratum]|nr:unnamed protein product [Effrenium voratum]
MPKARRFAAAWALATPWLAFIASDRSASRLALHAKKGPDVRALLESAGLLPPKPTETWLPEEEAEFETPLDQLRQSIEQNLIRPNVETLVPEGEIEFETPLDSLQKLNASSPLEWLTQSLPRERLVEEGEEMAFQTPLSFLFQEDEDFEEEEIWSDLLAPLLKGPAVVDTMNESNYVTVSLEKPLGMTVEENSKIFGGVSVVGLEEGSRAEGLGLIEPGWQLLMADGVPVHGMSLEDAIRPIEAAKGRLQITFFTGSAETFYGLLGPEPEWLSAFLRKLQVKHLAWQWQEGRGPPQGRTWSWALELLEELEDQESYGPACVAAMEACQKASRWEPALVLLQDLRAAPFVPPAEAFRAAVVACDRGAQHLRALWLLEPWLFGDAWGCLRTKPFSMQGARDHWSSGGSLCKIG